MLFSLVAVSTNSVRGFRFLHISCQHFSLSLFKVIATLTDVRWERTGEAECADLGLVSLNNFSRL